MGLYIIISLLIVFIVYQEIRHGKERKDLYDRIMSGSLEEYKAEPAKARTVKNIIRKNLDRQRNKIEE